MLLALAAAALLACTAIMAAEGTVEEIAWGHLAMGLFGMAQMSNALKSALGDQMKTLLAC